jgi:hypothetical protein
VMRRVREGKREEVRVRGSREHKTTDPTLSLFRQLCARLIFSFFVAAAAAVVVVVDCVKSRGNSFSFRYINDLELLLNDLQNLLYMESELLRGRRERIAFMGKEEEH